MFRPKLWTCLATYDRKQFLADLGAGCIVGVVALPLAMAFAIASGVSPEKGLYTAIVAGFLISALGGSRVQIGGPTGAFVVLVFDIVGRHGLDGLALCTLMAGGMLVVMGLVRLGQAIKFIPYPVIAGFTSGIAVIIFTSQIKDLLGLDTGTLPATVHGKWAIYLRSLGTIQPASALLAALSIAVILFFRKKYPRLPAPLIAMVVATVIAHVCGLSVDTIGSRFGGIPASLPRPQLPSISLERVRELLSPALSVALLAAIESLLSAVVADGMINGRHRPDTELIAQGIANLCSPLFGGIPATGAIARTATNIKSGGRTPVAGMVHAVTLLLLMLVFGRWASLVPMCSLAAILVVVAYNMSEWRVFANILRAPRSDLLVLLTTFVLTVVFDLSLAVQGGVVLASLLFVKRMADITRVRRLGRPGDARGGISKHEIDLELWGISGLDIPNGVEVYEIQGPFCFGAADKLQNTLPLGTRLPHVLILRMRHVPALDATGLHALGEFHAQCRARGTQLILAGVHARVRKKLLLWPETRTIGRPHLVKSLWRALAVARRTLDAQPPVQPQDRKDDPSKKHVA